jgi:hypothetical protein
VILQTIDALNTVFSPIPASGSAGHPVTNTEAVVFGIDVKYGIDYLSRSLKEDFDPGPSESLGTFAFTN